LKIENGLTHICANPENLRYLRAKEELKHIEKMMKHIEMMKHARQIGIRTKNFSPLQTRLMMVCRNGELHIDDIVGAGFARLGFARPHHRPCIELHKGDAGVGAKNFSPQRRLDCGDNQTSFSPNLDNKTTSVARRQHTYNNLIISLFPCTDVSSLRDLMKVGDVFSTDMSSLRDLPDDEYDTCEYTVNQVSSLRDLPDDDGYRMLKHTVNKVSSLPSLSSMRGHCGTCRTTITRNKWIASLRSQTQVRRSQ
jgi:hypothetical protein